MFLLCSALLLSRPWPCLLQTRRRARTKGKKTTAHAAASRKTPCKQKASNYRLCFPLSLENWVDWFASEAIAAEKSLHKVRDGAQMEPTVRQETAAQHIQDTFKGCLQYSKQTPSACFYSIQIWCDQMALCQAAHADRASWGYKQTVPATAP